MTTKQPDPLSKKELEMKYILDYDWKPSAEELQHFQRFCESIGTVEVLAQVLDPASHPKNKSGKHYRPRMADLYDLRDDIVRDLWREKREAEQDQQYSQDEKADIEVRACRFCVSGDVYDLVWLDNPGRWSVELLGVCAKCSNGTSLPSEEIIALAKSIDSNCRAVLWEIMIMLLSYRLGAHHQASQAQLQVAIKAVTAKFKNERAERRLRRQGPTKQTKAEVPF